MSVFNNNYEYKDINQYFFILYMFNLSLPTMYVKGVMLTTMRSGEALPQIVTVYV